MVLPNRPFVSVSLIFHDRHLASFTIIVVPVLGMVESPNDVLSKSL